MVKRLANMCKYMKKLAKIYLLKIFAVFTSFHKQAKNKITGRFSEESSARP